MGRRPSSRRGESGQERLSTTGRAESHANGRAGVCNKFRSIGGAHFWWSETVRLPSDGTVETVSTETKVSNATAHPDRRTRPGLVGRGHLSYAALPRNLPLMRQNLADFGRFKLWRPI